jgi:uncharacterized protein YdeI (YjbR/CyaY-like superfamily)
MELYKDLPILTFDEPQALQAWLERHHADAPGFWLRIYKKGSGKPTVTYAEALDEALCYGWIDSTKNAYDAESFLQRFTPRKARSVWSQVNRDHVARLIEAGRMQPPGLRMIEEAKRNGQWEAAYAPSSRMTVPEDLQALLEAEPETRDFFETLSKTNRYALLYRIQNVKKAETRLKRLDWAMDLLRRKETLY